MVETDPFLGALLFEKCPGAGTPEPGCLVEQTAMNIYEPTEVEGTDPEPRTERALTEAMTVLPEGGDVYTVVGENQNGEYQVDAREGRCTCPDHRHRGVECKHQRRVAFATGAQPIPAGVEGVDSLLGAQTDETPLRAVSDGGVTDDDTNPINEVLPPAEEAFPTDEREGEERPADCDCWNADRELPCWPCYREGFRSQNPEEPAREE